MQIFKKFRFEAAHFLPHLPEDHKCRRMHGHSFEAEIYVGGPMDERLGWVIDFADVAQAFKPLEEKLDHRLLNEVEGLENPTSENLARWFWEHLETPLPGLCRVVVRETCNAGCIYDGPRTQD